ncbi:MAG: head-tail connector protein [Prevotella sp.]
MNEQKDTGLRWLNLDAIHQHCRIDFNCEDAELEQFGMAAEQAVLDLTRRTFENFVDTYGRIPDPIFNASQLLVQSLYKNRDAEEQRDSKEIAFGFSFMVKNYMVLTGGSPLEVERDGLLDKLTVVMTEFDFDFGEIEKPSEDLVEDYDTQRRDMAALYNRYAYIANPTSYICEKFRQAIAKAKEDCDKIINPETT